MPKYLLTNEVIATELWKMLETNPAYSEDLTTKAKVAKSAVCTYFKFRPGVQETVAGDFPNLTLAKSGWRTDSPLKGCFASGTWTFKVRLESDTKYGFSVKVAVRLSKSTFADGSSATLITVSESPNVINIPASAGGSVSDTWTWSAPKVTLVNQYLFAEFRIHIEVAGTSTACQCSFVCDEDPTVADESITTTTFTPFLFTFGYDTLGGTGTLLSTSTAENITGSVFTIPEGGTADSITVALSRAAAGSNNVKCAIYKHSDLSLVGVTEQVLTSMLTAKDWHTFNFLSPKPTLEPNTEYVLVVWGDYTAEIIYIWYDAGVANQGHFQALAYNGFPDPLVPTHNNNKYSIFCSYTPVVVKVPVFVGDGLSCVVA